MKTPKANIRPGQEGYVLVAALVTLLLLTVLGIWATRSTNFELRTAANDRLHKQAFYQADSGVDLAERLIYHNMLCVNASYMRAYDSNDPDKQVELQGFDNTSMPYPLRFDDKNPRFENGNLIFFDAEDILSPGATQENNASAKKLGRAYDPEKDEPWDASDRKKEDQDPNEPKYNRTFMHCVGAQSADECNDERHPRTNVLIGSQMAAKKGQGLIQSSGYEGFGVGAANVGFYWTYKIRSQHKGGIAGNESRVNVIWQLSGMNVSQARDEDCNYGPGSQRFAGSGRSGN